MNKSKLCRRNFIKGTIGAGIVFSGSPFFTSCIDFKPYDAKGLPTSVLGKTGVEFPRIALGLGSRFCTIDSEEDALGMLTFALDNGLYYWDTAHIYENKKNGVISEDRIGKIVKHRRNEIFLSTKVTSRNPDEAKKQIEISLKRLQTDKLDILKIHAVDSLEDIDQMSKKGQLIEIVHRMKEEGVARFIGFSGHGDAEAMKIMAHRGDFDTMLIAMNHWGKHKNNRKDISIPEALEKNLGVMVMKAIRPKDKNPDFNGKELIRYALSLDGPSGLVLGMDGKKIVQKNLELLRNFKPMNAIEKNNMADLLQPFFKSKDLDWMQHGYRDGKWV